MNASVKVILFKSKTLKNGEHPVMLRVIKDRKSKYISTGFSCTSDMWDEKNNLPKKKHPLYVEAKILFAQKSIEANKLIIDLENDNKDLSANEIKNKLKKGKTNNQSVYEYFDTIIKRLVDSGQVKNSKVYLDTKRNLIHFTGLSNIYFSEINIEFLNKFEEFLKSKNKGGNTIFLYFRTLRALLNKAINENVCNEKYYPFRKFSLSKYSRIKTDKRAISKDDVQKIIGLGLTNKPHLIDARNIFMFSYYCRGINFIDISFLKWKDINKGRLIYTRQKTKEFFNIELLKPVKEILDYYKPFTFKNSESFIFPIFNENHNTPNMIYNRREKMNKIINKNLKEIGELAKIDEHITIYVARHTYANVLKQTGVPTSIIKELMGHDSEKTTKIYLEDFGNKILDDATKGIL